MTVGMTLVSWLCRRSQRVPTREPLRSQQPLGTGGGLLWTEAGGKAAAPLRNQWLRFGEH